MKAFYSDHFVLPLPEGHRFPMAKYSMLRERVAFELTGIEMLEAPAATEGELALAHSPNYVHAVKTGGLSPQALREMVFLGPLPWLSVPFGLPVPLSRRPERPCGKGLQAI